MDFTEQNNKYFIIPTELIDDTATHNFALPIFAFLQYRKGKDERITVSMKDLMAICGYNTASRSNIKKILPDIKSALIFLMDAGYIYQFLDTTGFLPLDKCAIDLLQAGDYFAVEINPCMSDELQFGFIAVTIYEYGKLYESMFTVKPEVPLWKVVVAYIYIYRCMWKRKGFLKEDRFKLTKEIVEKQPEFAYFKIDTICQNLGDGFSQNTITKIIKYFEAIEIMHTVDFCYGEKIVTDKNGRKREVPFKRGTIFIRHSNMWKEEAEAALYVKFHDYKKLFRKGGQGDI